MAQHATCIFHQFYTYFQIKDIHISIGGVWYLAVL